MSCNPFSEDWPECLNDLTEEQIHQKLAEAALAGAMTVLQKQQMKEELIASPDTTQQTKQHVGSWPTLGD